MTWGRAAAANDGGETGFTYQRLLELLQATGADMSKVRARVTANVKNLTNRFLLTNATLDVMTWELGKHSPTRLLDEVVDQAGYSFAANSFPKGGEREPLVQAINKATGESLKALAEDRKSRLSASRRDREKLTSDPEALRWIGQLLYNYSLDIAETKHEQLKAHAASPDGQAGRPLALTEELFQARLQSDGRIQNLFRLVGVPEIGTPYEQTKGQWVVDWVWRLDRQGSNPPYNREEARVRLFDTTGSDGGKPVPGVSAKAQVLVRKEVGGPIERIPLGGVKRNYFVQSIDQLENLQNAEVTWTRVVGIESKTTPTVWRLGPGDPPLDVAPAQEVLAFENGNWTWQVSSTVSPSESREISLLGVQKVGLPQQQLPDAERVSVVEGDPLFDLAPAPIEDAEEAPAAQPTTESELATSGFEPFAVPLMSASGIWEETPVITLTLSKDKVGAYFADERLVKAEVQKPEEGVDGRALAETPKGVVPLDDVRSRSTIHTFSTEKTGHAVKVVESAKSVLVEFFVTVSYRAGGQLTRLKLAEDQRLLVFDGYKAVRTVAASDLELGDLLVRDFGPPGSLPVTTEVVGLAGSEEPLGVVRLDIWDECVIRANGLLVPMNCVREKLPRGLRPSTQIQLAPGADTLGASIGTGVIELSSSGTAAAREVGVGARLLSFEVIDSPIRFDHTPSAVPEEDLATRFLRITTSMGVLEVGHHQEVYVSLAASPSVDVREAQTLHKGDLLIWLDRQDPSAANTQRVPILSIEERMPEKGVEIFPVLTYEPWPSEPPANTNRLEPLSGDTGPLLGNAFANGFLVKLVPLKTGPGEGPSGGGEGSRPGDDLDPSRLSDTRVPRRSYDMIRDLPEPGQKFRFAKGAEQFFASSENKLRNMRIGPINDAQINRDYMARFLGKYYRFFDGEGNALNSEQVGALGAATAYRHLGRDLRIYLNAREQLIVERQIRSLPILVNEYSYLAFLLYSAGLTESGDLLTSDLLGILSYLLAANGWERYFGEENTRFRSSLIVVRDLLLYIRDQGEGVRAARGISIGSEGWGQAIGALIEAKPLNSDVLTDGDEVNLYRLVKQLDGGVRRKLSLPTSIFSPSFKGSEVLKGKHLESVLPIQQNDVKVE